MRQHRIRRRVDKKRKKIYLIQPGSNLDKQIEKLIVQDSSSDFPFKQDVISAEVTEGAARVKVSARPLVTDTTIRLDSTLSDRSSLAADGHALRPDHILPVQPNEVNREESSEELPVKRTLSRTQTTLRPDPIYNLQETFVGLISDRRWFDLAYLFDSDSGVWVSLNDRTLHKFYKPKNCTRCYKALAKHGSREFSIKNVQILSRSNYECLVRLELLAGDDSELLILRTLSKDSRGKWRIRLDRVFVQ